MEVEKLLKKAKKTDTHQIIGGEKIRVRKYLKNKLKSSIAKSTLKQQTKADKKRETTLNAFDKNKKKLKNWGLYTELQKAFGGKQNPDVYMQTQGQIMGWATRGVPVTKSLVNKFIKSEKKRLKREVKEARMQKMEKKQNKILELMEQKAKAKIAKAEKEARTVKLRSALKDIKASSDKLARIAAKPIENVINKKFKPNILAATERAILITQEQLVLSKDPKKRKSLLKDLARLEKGKKKIITGREKLRNDLLSNRKKMGELMSDIAEIGKPRKGALRQTVKDLDLARKHMNKTLKNLRDATTLKDHPAIRRFSVKMKHLKKVEKELEEQWSRNYLRDDINRRLQGVKAEQDLLMGKKRNKWEPMAPSQRKAFMKRDKALEKQREMALLKYEELSRGSKNKKKKGGKKKKEEEGRYPLEDWN